MAGKFYSFLAHIPVEVGKNFLQCMPCFLRRQQFGIRDYPNAELMVVQPGLEKWDQDVQQISLRVVEGTETRAPGDVASYADPSAPLSLHDALPISGCRRMAPVKKELTRCSIC